MRKEFERVTPESVGLHSEAIAEYINNLQNSGETEMHGIMVMRHGKVCAEGWWAPYAPNLRHGLQSHTKTYAATAVGIAYTEGILKLDERVIDIFPDEAPENPSENLKLLTVRDVLCMGCGMETMPRDSVNWIRDFLAIPVVHKPGTAYMYNSTGSTLLGAIVRKKTGLGLHDYLTPRLFNKIGIDPDNLRWYCMADGMEMGGGGLFATTEDNLRLLKLYADGGVWEGERILAEDYVKLATTNQNDSATEAIGNPLAFDNHVGYGFQIWMCQPKDVYRADGAMGQFTIVFPHHDMIIAINETAGVSNGVHWAQKTLDITWEFLKRVDELGEATEENEKALTDLRNLTARLNTPVAAYKPYSPMIEKINGKTFKMISGAYALGNRGMFGGGGASKMAEFRLDFDNYGCNWVSKNEAGEETQLRIATFGGRFTNLLQKPEDQTRLVCTDAAWISDNEFKVNMRWAETCMTKRLVFRFEDNKVTLDEESNSAFRFGPKDPIVAEMI